jgi:hypothetical protein
VPIGLDTARIVGTNSVHGDGFFRELYRKFILTTAGSIAATSFVEPARLEEVDEAKIRRIRRRIGGFLSC